MNDTSNNTEMVTLPEAFNMFWSKYADFDTQSTRAEYWWWQLCQAGIIFALTVFSSIYGIWIPIIGAFCEIVAIIFTIATIIPNIALSVRRLHDSGHSGMWWFIGFIPLIGAIILLIFYCLPTVKRPNLN